MRFIQTRKSKYFDEKRLKIPKYRQNTETSLSICLVLTLVLLLLLVAGVRLPQLVPMDDGPPRVVHHLHPVLLLQLLPTFSKRHLK